MFDPKASSTSAIEVCNKTLTCSKCQASPSDPSVSQCGFKDSYLTCDLSNLTAVCSVAGVIYSDSVTIAGISANNVRFGGIDKQTTNFDQFKQIDGILGLAFSGDSRGSQMGFDDTPFQRLVDQNVGLENVVQTCLTPEGGLLVLGRDDERDRQFYNGTLQWSPITLAAWWVPIAAAMLSDPVSCGIRVVSHGLILRRVTSDTLHDVIASAHARRVVARSKPRPQKWHNAGTR